MPPRPPLSCSSSFSLLPLSDTRSSYEQPPPSRMTCTQSTREEPFDKGRVAFCREYPPSFTPTKEEGNGGSIYSHPDYGGAGRFSEPHDRRIRSFTMKREKEKVTAASFFPIDKDENMTRRIGTWLAASYIFRQVVYIFAIGLIFWIPGLLALLRYGASVQNKFDRPTVLAVGLVWWSIWLSSAWVAIWVCSLVASLTPVILRRSLGVLAVAFKDVIVYAEATKRYIAFLLWSIIVWVVFLSTVWSQFPGRNEVPGSTINPLTSSNSTVASSDPSTTSPLTSLLSLVPSSLITSTSTSLLALQSNEAWLISLSRFLAGIAICSAILLIEKVAMQWIAVSFNQTTYNDRIEFSNFHIAVLTTLYSNALSSSMVNASISPVQEGKAEEKRQGVSTVFSRAQKFKKAITASQSEDRKPILGLIGASLPLQSSQFPFSTQAVVEAALESAAQSRKLAKQIFYSFAKSKDAKTGEKVLREVDIALYFKTEKEGQQAFQVLDCDDNESCTFEEVQASILAMHKERICLLASLHDVDCAVLMLDNFFMSFYFFISCVIIAALLSTKFSTLVASLGTILLGLSWLVGTTAQESLASIVWVFGKHPVDVGDAIEVPGLVPTTVPNESVNIFIVEEIQLLNTILKTNTGKQVIVSNYQLAQKPILNLRRSGPTQEMITITVEYCTSLETIEKLRTKMMEWIDGQARDFLPGLNIELDCLGDQSHLSLTLDIRFKSNWQDEHLKAIRKNRWIAALKMFMEQLNICGPNGNPKKRSDTEGNARSRVASFSLTDHRNANRDGKSSENDSLAGDSQSQDTTLQPQLPSRLNEAMPSSASARRHSNPTTQLTSLYVQGRGGHNKQHDDDLERGERVRPF